MMTNQTNPGANHGRHPYWRLRLRHCALSRARQTGLRCRLPLQILPTKATSAFAILAAFDEKNVEVTQSDLVECEHRSDESGRWLKMNFCPKCGTTVYHTAEVRPGMKTIAAGTFDEQGWFGIDRHIWAQSKQDWVTIPVGVAIYPKAFTPNPQLDVSNSKKV